MCGTCQLGGGSLLLQCRATWHPLRISTSLPTSERSRLWAWEGPAEYSSFHSNRWTNEFADSPRDLHVSFSEKVDVPPTRRSFTCFDGRGFSPSTNSPLPIAGGLRPRSTFRTRLHADREEV